MRTGIFPNIISLFLIAVVLCTTAVGACKEAHASGDFLCKGHGEHNGAASVAMPAGQCDSCPDADHSEPDHCTTACYCPCHLPVISTEILLRYAPETTSSHRRVSCTPPQDIFLSLFVPPDNLA